MKMKVSRRDLLTFAGGSAVGLMLSPAPWKLIDDLAIWTQNWGWIPTPPRGEETVRRSTCSLCPAACPVEARCIAGTPVSLRAAGSAAALCSLGMTAHHLPWHPSRLTAPARIERNGHALRPEALSLQMVLAAIAGRSAAGSLAILDLRPGRSISAAWRQLAAQRAGVKVLAAPGREGASLATLERMTATLPGSLGADLEHAEVILSFGAPFAEGYGSPALLRRLLTHESAPELIQVEPVQSPTARLADRWLPARPGTEGVLALALAHVIIAEERFDRGAVSRAEDFDRFAALAAEWTPDRAAVVTGLAPVTIVETALAISGDARAIAIPGEDAGGGPLPRPARAAILSLDVLIGAVGRDGGIVAREPLPEPLDGPLADVLDLERVDDESLPVLLIDASAGDAPIPWSLVRRKLAAKDALVVVLSPWLAGSARHADFVVPVPAPYESIQEIPTPFDAPQARLALSDPLFEARESSVDPAAFIRSLADVLRSPLPGDWTSSADLIAARLEAIHRGGTGSVANVTEAAETALSDISAPESLRDALLAGGIWRGAGSALQLSSISLMAELEGDIVASGRRGELTLLTPASRDVSAAGAVSPVLTKLYQESGLRRGGTTAAINPRTARELGLRDEAGAVLRTPRGEARVTVATDEAVMPGLVVVSAAPHSLSLGVCDDPEGCSPLDLCEPGPQGGWRGTPVTLVEV